MSSTAFRPLDLIIAKREGQEHPPADVKRMVDGFVAGEVPDYQVAAWLMAICWRGMTPAETAALTVAMAESGERLDLSGLPHTVDKHSTGGVGDKTTIVLAPLLASLGATVAKMSGRGLGHTGGTVDKLESIPGFSVDLSDERFLRQAREVGVVVTGQSKEMAPADGLMYALRDVTGTVESLPLIAASVMSKKLAGGAQSIVLDVKLGSGAFMRTEEDAEALARTMTEIGSLAGRKVTAVLSDMSEPLGFAVGNSLEVLEALECLKGGGPADLRELCVVLAGQVLASSGLDGSRRTVERALDDGSALERFEAWVAAQGGDAGAVATLPLAEHRHVVRAPASGVLSRLEARAIGQAVGVLGGGRAKKGDAVDHGVGVELHAKVGAAVDAGDPVATLIHREGRGIAQAVALVEGALSVSHSAEPPRLVVRSGLGS